jgi:tRNA threonylcarbamoyladenosine biosynthesis protein TsaB
LRIGAGVAQGLAFGADIPVAPISSLAALAQGVDAPRVLAAFDARMNQVYSGAYVRNAQGIVELAGIESVTVPSDVPLPEGNNWLGAGNGWDQYHAALLQRLGNHVVDWRKQVHPRARDVAQLGAVAVKAGHAIAAEQALPVYVRDDVAVKQVRS